MMAFVRFTRPAIGETERIACTPAELEDEMRLAIPTVRQLEFGEEPALFG